MKRSATAIWSGDFDSGTGEVTSDSGVLSRAQQSRASRFGDGHGSSPEELIAAAHASCFSMALAHELSHLNARAEQINTMVSVELVPDGPSYRIATSHITVNARAAGIGADDFRRAAEHAKDTCPVSKSLNAEITLTADFESAGEPS